MTQYLDKDGLEYLLQQLEENFVEQQEGMGLSHNDLTDELLEKIKNAGDSSFNGSYNNLTDIPTLDGNEIKGTLTAEGLGLAKSDKVAEDIQSAKTELQSKIDAAVSSVYKPAGSVEFDALPTPSAENLGDVYNVTNSFITDDKFVEPISQVYPAGTNVVVVSPVSDTYKYDVLAGFVDTTNFVEKSDIQTITTGDIDEMFETLFPEP